MEQKNSPATDDLVTSDVISPYRDWYIDSAIFENIAMTDEEELALMFFLYFWGGETDFGLCNCPNCNPDFTTSRGQQQPS